MNQIKEQILKPCPFCGGEAELFQKGKNGFTIYCGKCRIERTQRVIHQTTEWLRNSMIEKWNNRVEFHPSFHEVLWEDDEKKTYSIATCNEFKIGEVQQYNILKIWYQPRCEAIEIGVMKCKTMEQAKAVVEQNWNGFCK